MGLKTDVDGPSVRYGPPAGCDDDPSEWHVAMMVRVRHDKMSSKVCEGTAWRKEVHEGGDLRGA